MANTEPGNDDIFTPHMPEVDEHLDMEKIFQKVRKAAEGDRQVVLLTPGRMLMLQPCPPAGSMPAKVVTQIEKLISPKVKRKVAVIAYTEIKAVTTNLAKAIPFFGMLSGMAYIGHSVWVFEGHSSALAAGCQDADLVIVDGEMVPYLGPDWRSSARTGAPARQIYIHDRATHGLRKAD
jgi:hypothetical protein